MIGGAAFLSGIVTLPSPLLFAIERQDNRIQMKLQLTARLWQGKQLRPQPVVESDHLPNRRRWQALKKTAQRSLIGKSFQSDQGEKQSIVLENLGLVHALNPGDQDVE